MSQSNHLSRRTFVKVLRHFKQQAFSEERDSELQELSLRLLPSYSVVLKTTNLYIQSWNSAILSSRTASQMPLYSQLIIALPRCKAPELVSICRRHAKLILDNGGVVRGIENHGIRPLPARAKRFVVIVVCLVNCKVFLYCHKSVSQRLGSTRLTRGRGISRRRDS